MEQALSSGETVINPICPASVVEMNFNDDAGRKVRVIGINSDMADVAGRIALEGIPAGAELVYKGRNRVYAVDGSKGERLCVKCFRVPSLLNSYIYTNLRQGKARRSYENALLLKKLGIGTPEPFAYAEVKLRGRLRESYYICEMLPSENLRLWEEKPDCEPLLREFAHEMVKIHAAGVFFKDFSPGNALYTNYPGEGYRFYFVDLNRMEFGVKSRTKLMRNFRAINLSERETERLARLYAEAAGIDAAAAARDALGRLAAYKRSKKVHRFFKRIKKIFKS